MGGIEVGDGGEGEWFEGRKVDCVLRRGWGRKGSRCHRWRRLSSNVRDGFVWYWIRLRTSGIWRLRVVRVMRLEFRTSTSFQRNTKVRKRQERETVRSSHRNHDIPINRQPFGPDASEYEQVQNNTELGANVERRCTWPRIHANFACGD